MGGSRRTVVLLDFSSCCCPPAPLERPRGGRSSCQAPTVVLFCASWPLQPPVQKRSPLPVEIPVMELPA